MAGTSKDTTEKVSERLSSTALATIDPDAWLTEYAKEFPRYAKTYEDEVPSHIAVLWGGYPVGFAHIIGDHLYTAYTGSNHLLRRLMTAMSTERSADEREDLDEYDTGILEIGEHDEIPPKQRMAELVAVLKDLPGVTVGESQPVSKAGFALQKALLEKDEWQPYTGPRGGEGWQHVSTGEVRYTEEPPSGTSTVDADAPKQFHELEVGDRILFDPSRGRKRIGEVLEILEPEGLHPDGAVNVLVETGRKTFRTRVQPDEFIRAIYTDEGHDIEIPRRHVEGPENADGNIDWFQEHGFVGQEVRLYDHYEEETIEGTLLHADQSSIRIKAYDREKQVRLDMDNRYTLVSGEDWDKMESWERRAAMMYRVTHGVRYREISDYSKHTFTSQVRDTIIPSFKDTDQMRFVMEKLSRVKNRVSRASCGGQGYYHINLESDVDPETTFHEFGHGILNAYKYDYLRLEEDDVESDAMYENRPWAMAHFHRQKRNEHGLFEFDFSEDGDFPSPVSFMFHSNIESTVDPSTLEPGDTVDMHFSFGGKLEDRVITSVEPSTERGDGWYSINIEGWDETYSVHTDGRIIDESGRNAFSDITQTETAPVAYEHFKQDIDNEVEGIVYGDLESRDYDSDWDENDVKKAFDGLQAGDAVAFNVGSHSFETGETQYSIKHAVYTGEKNESDPRFITAQEYDFERFTEGTPLRFRDKEGEIIREATVQEVTDDYATIVDRETGETETFTASDINRHRIDYSRDGWDGKTTYYFTEPDGEKWSWNVDNASGKLITSQGSSLIGVDYSRSEEADEQLKIPEKPANPDNPSHPLSNWTGFNTGAETHEEKIENLVHAVNRSWYKQAKYLERYASSKPFEAMGALVNTNYAAANAHETMAMAHETFQSGTPERAIVTSIVREHPWLVTAYLDVFNPSEAVRDILKTTDFPGKDDLL